MVSTPEKKVKMAIKSWLASEGYYFFFPVAGPFSVHGVPDILVCAEGRFIGIEVKAPGKANNTTVNQDTHIAAINENGGIAFVADSLDQVVAQFRTLGL